MTSFRSTKQQSQHLVGKKTQLGASRHELKKFINSDFDIPITSCGTRDKYEYCVKSFLDYLKLEQISIEKVNEEIAHDFLKLKSADCKQKTINGYRQSITKIFCIDVPYVVSDIETVKNQRAYTDQQIKFLSSYAKPMLSLSIRIAAASGMRAIELDTVCLSSDMPEDKREWVRDRFAGKDSYAIFVVHGKGGLRRKVALPKDLAEELEKYRLDQPMIKTSRNIRYKKYYSLIGGHSFSQQFTRLIKKIFGWSSGAHGLRHSFAQRRMRSIQCCGLTFIYALKIVGHELGHFDIKNTMEYLR